MITRNLKIRRKRDNSCGSERDHGCLWLINILTNEPYELLVTNNSNRDMAPCRFLEMA